MKNSWMWLMAVAMVGCGGSAKEPASASSAANEVRLEEADSRASADPAEIERAARLIEAGQFEAARAILEEAIQRQPSHGAAAYYLGVALEGLGDPSGAAERYRDALKLEPDLAEAAINLGALYIDAGRFDDAVRVTNAALGKRPHEPALLTNLALALEGQGKKDAALAAYAKALKGAEGNAALRFQYASLLLETGDKDRAIEALKAALTGAADDRALLASIGRALGTAGAFADCVTALDRAIAVGDAADLRIGRGLCRHSLEDEPGAKQDFEKAVQLAPEYAPGHYYLGRSLLSLGKRDAGIRSLEKAASLAKDTPLASKAREEAAAARKKK